MKLNNKEYVRDIFIIGVMILSLIGLIGYFGVQAQDKKAESRNYTLTQQEKQTIIDIYQRLELAATQKALAETKMQLEQERFDKAISELKKVRGCEGCTFDASRLELVAPAVESKKEVKP